ncbi:hypothetical protein [Sphingomonas kyeonggiensis]|uniref:Uncharacterized protein n=1 Tax=Sphingomonas kyeonggiensis TaxID=1268553 RepID=A0A7W6JNC8_9SPHN|nr:hypothetical protein [Sphingomonas kyeonggiensis]MBB4096565.1 hypothetical protein [Sphingomonas kyeonggiensis]
MIDDVRNNAVLVLEIGYFDAADARTSGTAIERLANAFAQETRAGQSRYGLELVRVEIASLHAWFDLGKTMLDLYEQRALLGGFLQTVAVALETVMNASGGNVGQISASVRSFLVSLAGPIVRKQASHARLSVQGDNNTIIYIETLQAERIDQLFDAPRRVRGGGGFGPIYVEKAQEARANLPAPEETSATLLNIAGAWYARPAGFQGVMLPVAQGSVALEKLAEAQSYTAAGTIVREGGNPTAFRVRRMERG